MNFWLNSGWLLLLLLLPCDESIAQNYSFRHYQVENGLSNNTVYCSIQDSKGFLWFGTKDGLNRFDGYRFKVYNDVENQQKLMNTNYVDYLTTNSKGELWVACRKGIYSFNYEKDQLEIFIDSLEHIATIKHDELGNMWIVADSKLYKYDSSHQKLREIKPPSYLHFTYVEIDKSGRIWVSTANGYLVQYDPKKNFFHLYNLFGKSPPVVSHYVKRILPTESNTLLIGTISQGIKEFDLNTLSYRDLLTHNSDSSSIYVRDIMQFSPDEYWFATESGIIIYDAKKKFFKKTIKKSLGPFSLNDNAVYTLTLDREGAVWAGTYFGGVNYYSKKNDLFKKYYPDNSTNSISGNIVREICDDKFGNIWLGTEDAGLNRINKKTGLITQYKPTGHRDKLSYTNIHGLLAVGSELWIGTFEHGLDVMDIVTGKIIRHYTAGDGPNQFRSNFIVSLFQSSDKIIYVGSAASLYRYDPVNDNFNLVKEVPENIFVSSIIEDHEGIIWVASGNGMKYFNPRTGLKGELLTDPPGDRNRSYNRMNSVFEDSKRQLWFATEGRGLVKMSADRKKMTAFTTKQGLPSNFIMKVIEDDHGSIWITTSRGLVNYDDTTNKFTVFTKANGLLNDQFNYSSAFRDSTGVLYFGSLKGMISIQPDDLKDSQAVAPLYITDFSLQNSTYSPDEAPDFLTKSILTAQEIKLPYDKSSFSIEFAALSFIAPEVTKYKYIMEGLDKEWTELSQNRTVYFTNLASGEYTFRLKAFTNDSWDGEERQLRISVTPAWYATGWAYALYTAILGSLAFYLFHLYHLHLNDKKEKEIYESKIDFFTNVAHEIRTPLTLIKGPIENLSEQIENFPAIKYDVKLMERNTERLLKLVSQILDFRKVGADKFLINYSTVNVSELLAEYFDIFSDLSRRRNLSYEIYQPEPAVFTVTDEEALRKIFSNLFANAVKYADSVVGVKLFVVPETKELVIEFYNDGSLIPENARRKIFEPFYRLEDTLSHQGTGIGLALTISLTKLLKGDIYVKDDEKLNVFVLRLPLTQTENTFITDKQ